MNLILNFLFLLSIIDVVQSALTSCAFERSRSLAGIDMSRQVEVNTAFLVEIIESAEVETPTLVVVAESEKDLNEFDARVFHSVTPASNKISIEVKRDETRLYDNLYCNEPRAGCKCTADGLCLSSEEAQLRCVSGVCSDADASGVCREGRGGCQCTDDDMCFSPFVCATVQNEKKCVNALAAPSSPPMFTSSASRNQCLTSTLFAYIGWSSLFAASVEAEPHSVACVAGGDLGSVVLLLPPQSMEPTVVIAPTPAPPTTTTASATTTANNPSPSPTQPPATKGWPPVAMPVVAPTEKVYTLELSRWGVSTSPTVKPVNNTAAIQAAINWASDEGYTKFIFPDGEYLVGDTSFTYNYVGALRLKSNMVFELSSGATLRMAPNDRWNYCLLSIRGLVDVTVRGGTLIGERLKHVFAPDKNGKNGAHDEGHVICVEGASQRILIDSVLIKEANGDGILIVGKEPGPGNVTVINSEFDYNRRQGISIVGASDVRIENNHIHHTNGTSPQFGIDIEPLSGYLVENIIIRKNKFHDNFSGDVVNTSGRNVLIENNTMTQGDIRYYEGPIVLWPNSDNTIRFNNITMRNGSVNGRSGIIQYSRKNSSQKNPAFTYVHDNVCNGCGVYFYWASNVELRNNQWLDGYIVLQHFHNLQIFDNRVVQKSRCWAYRFKNVTGAADGNTLNDEPFPIPLNLTTGYNGCWIN